MPLAARTRAADDAVARGGYLNINSNGFWVQTGVNVMGASALWIIAAIAAWYSLRRCLCFNRETSKWGG